MSTLVVSEGEPVGGGGGGGVVGGVVGGGAVVDIATFENAAVIRYASDRLDTASPAYTLAPMAIVTLLPCCLHVCPSADA
jgi:hypothetical protein